ncbi:RNA polymerase sigma factor [Tistrella sp.]|uniref:RNA polymerase sigma factor n=1 Tax=Tistrella sp. TaxID=2024861 RepID=UPI000C8DB447|nr:sigma-70 family RNA polymerase sigma factor [Tistrella sp.]MAD35615.1 RNA polymerase subunit sigma-24 [Tistrella sp.]
MTLPDTDPDAAVRRAVETVFRMERARLIGGLARMLRDIDLAEDLAQEALLAALADWPRSGIPARPGAWLMATAKRRAIDRFRHRRMQARKLTELGHAPEDDGAAQVTAAEAAMDDDLGDEILGLIFAACHPLLTAEARVALTLRLIGGLTTDEIAPAFLAKDATIAQRILRAKKTLGRAGLAWEIPEGDALKPRLASVLEVIYLVFNEGYAATAGDDLIRPALADEARRLGRILAAAMPGEAEIHGLCALMDLQASRFAARVAPDGSPVPLTGQDRRLWDRTLIRRGLDALAKAEAAGGADGPYALQAALAACHARAGRAEDTDWPRIAGLYDRLAVVMPSPVVELNRAVAHGVAFGPGVGLALLAPLDGLPALAGYAPLQAAIGDMLARAGQPGEAQARFTRAASLTSHPRERDFLLARAAACVV